MTLRSPWKPLRLPLFLLFLLAGVNGADAEEATEAPLARPEPLSLELQTSRNRIYYGEKVQVSVTLHAAGVPLRNVGYPKLAGSGFGMPSFPSPVEESENSDGESRLSYRFTTTITPKRSGTIVLGPAQLECEQVVPASGPGAFFGGTENRELVLLSQPIPIEVLPLPEAGRPGNFRGAVGRFTVQRTAHPADVRVGDPVTVRTVVRGSGTVGRIACEPIVASGIRAYPPLAVGGGDSLTCEQVVVPESPSLRELPPATVHFFDPSSGRYTVAKSATVALRVAAPPEEVPQAAAADPAQPAAVEAEVPEGSQFLPLWGWSAAPLCLMAALVAGSLYRRRLPSHPLPPPQGGRGPMRPFGVPATAATGPLPAQHPTGIPAPAPAMASPGLIPEAECRSASADIDGVYTALFRSLQSCLAHPLNTPPAGITGPLPGDLLPPELLLDAEALLRRCHEVRYGKLRPDAGELSLDLRTHERIISFCSTRQ